MPKLTEGDLVERVKRILFLKGKHSCQVMNDLLRDLSLLSKPHNKVFTKKNDILPFEDPNSLEFLGPKNDCGLFTFASHSKKRPNNLVIGRTYDSHLLDMYEFGVDNFVSMEDFKGDKKAFASKPLMVFLGNQWEIDSLYMNIQNLLLDYFRGVKTDKISLRGVDHVISCSVHEGKIYIRTYYVNYQKSNEEVPNLVLKPMGPFMDLSVRRSQTASEDLWKAACKKPKMLKPSKVKNIERNEKGDKLGRIHMKKQDLDNMKVRYTGALRTNGKRSRSEGDVSSSGRKSSSTGKRPRSQGDASAGKKSAAGGPKRKKAKTDF